MSFIRKHSVFSWVVAAIVVLIGGVALAELMEGQDANRIRRPVKIGTDGSLSLSDTGPIGSAFAKLDDDNASNCVAITTTSAEFDLSSVTGWTAGDTICMDADGNTAYILCGTSPVTATTTVGTGFAFTVASGEPSKCRRLTGASCAVIGLTNYGSICFEHLDSDL